MPKKTVRSIVLDILAKYGRMRKGALEDLLRARTGTLGDTTARRLREMADDGEILKSAIAGDTFYELTPTTPRQLAIGEHITNLQPEE